MSDIAERREAIQPVIEETQRELREALDDLQHIVQERFDLRMRIAQKPLPWLVGGVLFGLWLGSHRN